MRAHQQHPRDMHFAGRSLVATHRYLGHRSWQRGRPLRSRRWTTHHAQPESVALRSAQPTALSTWNKLPMIMGGLFCGMGLFTVSSSRFRTTSEAEVTQDVISWHESFARNAALVKVPSPRSVLSASPLTKNLIQQDNLFDKMMEVEMVKDIHYYYDPRKKEFHSIVHLGKEVCGYPYTVHGGLTAAIVDETFGGLMFNIWRSGDLGFSLPAVTARLEVDYCNRLPQNSVVRCRTKLEELGKREGRSFWMEAELCDQSGAITYATARACFVSPSWSRSAIKWIKGITGN